MKEDEVGKILIVKFGGMGDVFLSTIVIDSLRAFFPHATLDYLVAGAGREAIVHDPRINALIVLDKKEMHPVSVILDVRRRRYDVVIDLFGNPRSAIITFFSGAKFRVGLDYGWRRHLYSIVGKASRGKLHGAEVNLQALVAMQIPLQNPTLAYPLSPEDISYADGYWDAHRFRDKFVVGFLPAGSWPSKRCEPAKFAEIASAIMAKYGAEVIVVGGPDDERDAGEIQRRVGERVTVVPRASLRHNVSLLSRCNAIIANDSGPMHLASAFGVPILCIYGPTFPEGPYGKIHSWVRNEGLSCLVCNKLHCPIQHQCMTEIPLQRVMDAFDAMVRRNGMRGEGRKKEGGGV